MHKHCQPPGRGDTSLSLTLHVVNFTLGLTTACRRSGPAISSPVKVLADGHTTPGSASSARKPPIGALSNFKFPP
jgi:hypothetical protein